MSDPSTIPAFSQLGLEPALVRAVSESGYESPSAIQAAAIPPLLEGRDILGQAQTGTGKTAAFALPLLSRLDTTSNATRILVLTPTRELAIQVAEAFQHYARYLRNFHVLPIYGGSGFGEQLRGLRRGSQVIVGTPGRLMDHIRKETLKLDQLTAVVLDEADEMLRMGFIDDVEWILEHTPPQRQIALFSATMPNEIRRVADRYLHDPAVIRIEFSALTAESIEQQYWAVEGLHKLDALTRVLETEAFEAMIVFVRTRAATEDLAQRLSARGYACEALNGDIAQAQRERTINRLREKKLDILVATDVAARGLDVDHVTHVVNYDIPTDPEAYVHRIGRTGRAGRSGKALLFVAHRERHLLRAIERTIGRSITRMELPTAGDVNRLRVERFKNRIRETLATRDLDLFIGLLGDFQEQEPTDPIRLSAALAVLAQGDEPLLLSEERPDRGKSRSPAARESRGSAGRDSARPSGESDRRPTKRDVQRGRSHGQESSPPRAADAGAPPMVRYRIEVGAAQGVKPGHIVGAIASEAGLDGRYIGKIVIEEGHSLVDLPEGMPREIFQALRHTRVLGQKLEISLVESSGDQRQHDPNVRRSPNRSNQPGKERRPTRDRSPRKGHRDN